LRRLRLRLLLVVGLLPLLLGSTTLRYVDRLKVFMAGLDQFQPGLPVSVCSAADADVWAALHATAEQMSNLIEQRWRAS